MVPASVISAAIQGSSSFPGGPTWSLLADAVGNALATWSVVPGNIVIQGVTTGAVGSGQVIGTLQLTGGPSLVVAGLTAGGISGATVAQVGSAIGSGILTSLSGTLRYQGVSAGVAVGLDVSFVASANPSTLASAIQLAHIASTSALGGSGSALPSLYTALAVGIVSLIQTAVTVPGTGVVTPAGPVGPGSTVGTSTSFIV